jgi:hypothetical protein
MLLIVRHNISHTRDRRRIKYIIIMIDGRRHEKRLSSHSMNNGHASRDVQGERIMEFSYFGNTSRVISENPMVHTNRHTYTVYKISIL